MRSDKINSAILLRQQTRRVYSFALTTKYVGWKTSDAHRSQPPRYQLTSSRYHCIKNTNDKYIISSPLFLFFSLFIIRVSDLTHFTLRLKYESRGKTIKINSRKIVEKWKRKRREKRSIFFSKLISKFRSTRIEEKSKVAPTTCCHDSMLPRNSGRIEYSISEYSLFCLISS